MNLIERFYRFCVEVYEPERLGRMYGLPKCPFCKDRRRSWTFVKEPLFSVDRFSRARVRTVVRCNNPDCRMSLVMMRYADSRKWSFTETA